MTFENFKSILRTHYCLRESSKVMDEMVLTRQGEKQPLHKYVMQMMALRDEILDATISEECPLGEKLVYRRFRDSLLSGILKPTIRLEMQPLVNNATSDYALLEEVKGVMARDKENELKMAQAVQADTKALEVTRKKESERQDVIEKRLEKLTTTVLNLEALIRDKKLPDPKPVETSADAKVAMLIAHIEHLEAQVKTYEKDAGNSSRRDNNRDRTSGQRRKRYQCDGCKRTDSFCFHCSKCSEVRHYAANCPKNE